MYQKQDPPQFNILDFSVINNKYDNILLWKVEQNNWTNLIVGVSTDGFLEEPPKAGEELWETQNPHDTEYIFRLLHKDLIPNKVYYYSIFIFNSDHKYSIPPENNQIHIVRPIDQDFQTIFVNNPLTVRLVWKEPDPKLSVNEDDQWSYTVLCRTIGPYDSGLEYNSETKSYKNGKTLDDILENNPNFVSDFNLYPDSVILKNDIYNNHSSVSSAYIEHTLIANRTYYYTLFSVIKSGVYNFVQLKHRVFVLLPEVLVDNITYIRAKAEDKKILLSWKDPKSFNGAIWKGTLVVRNEDHIPKDIDDGVLILDETLWSQYNTQWYEDTLNLVNGKEYFYHFFPHDMDNHYNRNMVNSISAMPQQDFPDNVTNIGLALYSNSIRVSWTDPENTSWVGTYLVRNEDHYPEDINDGVILLDNRIKNHYSDIGYLDKGLNTNTTYYYSFFPYDLEGDFPEEVLWTSGTTINISYPDGIYGVKFDLSKDPVEAIYTDNADGLQSNPELWNDIPLFNYIRPCLLKTDGTVNYYLNTEDFNYKENGELADITSGLDGNVMIEIPLLGFSLEKSGSFLSVRVTNLPNEPGFSYDAFKRDYNSVQIANKIYIGAYLASNNGLTLFSLSNKSHGNLSYIKQYTMSRAIGLGYSGLKYDQITLIQALYLLKYKSLNSRESIGYGNFYSVITGTLNNAGMWWGDKNVPKYQDDGNRLRFPVKLCGLEMFYGYHRTWVDDLAFKYNGNITKGSYIQSGSYNYKILDNMNKAIYNLPFTLTQEASNVELRVVVNSGVRICAYSVSLSPYNIDYIETKQAQSLINSNDYTSNGAQIDKYLVYGPYIILPAGNYVATFKLGFLGSSVVNLGNVEVTYNAGANVIATVPITDTDFVSTIKNGDCGYVKDILGTNQTGFIASDYISVIAPKVPSISLDDDEFNRNVENLNKENSNKYYCGGQRFSKSTVPSLNMILQFGSNIFDTSIFSYDTSLLMYTSDYQTVFNGVVQTDAGSSLDNARLVYIPE